MNRTVDEEVAVVKAGVTVNEVITDEGSPSDDMSQPPHVGDAIRRLILRRNTKDESITFRTTKQQKIHPTRAGKLTDMRGPIQIEIWEERPPKGSARA